MEDTDTLEWKQARQWLISSGVIPPTHHITKPNVELIDFVLALRDGVFLCSVLEKLKPGSCPGWNPKPVMQHSFVKNIQTFLHALTSSFGFEEGLLFANNDLYEVDNFKKVMNTLSLLSQKPEALSLGLVPFPKEDLNHDYVNQEDDIYAPLQDIFLSDSNKLYSNVNNLIDEAMPKENPYGYGDESIYACVCPSRQEQSAETLDKKKLILLELCDTEQNFLKALRLITETFCPKLQSLISKEESDLLFTVLQKLRPVHETLLSGFEKWVEGDKLPNSGEITRVFMEQKDGLLNYGVYAAKLPLATEKAKDLQNRSDLVKVFQTLMEKSCQRFPLSDLLSLPIQRVLKYPLLVKELHKCARKGTSVSGTELGTLESLMALLEDIAKYINATKGDFEAIKSVKEVEASLSSYTGPSLLQFGRYCLDGELKVKLADQAQPKSKWVFLFEKALLVCKKVNRLGSDVRYCCELQVMVATTQVDLVTTLPKGKNAFKIINEKGEVLCLAKTDELKNRWVDAINHSKELTLPREGKKGLHSFELQNFDSPSCCDACKNLLHGCYFQGYTCTVCKRSAHKVCLSDIGKCQHKGPIKGNSVDVERPRHDPPFAIRPQSVRQHNDTNGMEERLKHFTWYLGKMSRIQAEQALSKMRDGVFLIRESDVRAGEYAIALKWKGMPKHIKISRQGNRRFCVADICDFLSVDELVEYYQHNTLGNSFPGVDTTLRFSVKDHEAPLPIGGLSSVAPVSPTVPHTSLSSSGHSTSVLPSYRPPTLPSHPSLTVQHSSVFHPAGSAMAPLVPPPTLWGDVLFAFTAECDDEISLEKNTRVKILNKGDREGWWFGEYNGKTGYFPANYVRSVEQ